MTEDDFMRIETELGVTLPPEYRRVMSVEGPKLVALALDYRRTFDGLDQVFLSANHVIGYNLGERPRDSGTGYAFKKWWLKFVMVGTSGGGDYDCLRLDAKPGVWRIGSDCGSKPTRTHPDFQSLADSLSEGYREAMRNPELVVSFPSLSIDTWELLRSAAPPAPDLGDDYWDFDAVERERFNTLASQGKSPKRVSLRGDELIAWCSTNGRPPDAAAREAFAAEELLREHPWVANARRQSHHCSPATS